MFSNFETKKKIVESGSSKVLQEWQKYSSITKEEFIEALEWVCEDPCDAGPTKNRLSREIGLTPTGYKKLTRAYWPDGSFKAFYETEGLKAIWNGSAFKVKCDDPNFDDGSGTVSLIYKMCLSCEDKV